MGKKLKIGPLSIVCATVLLLTSCAAGLVPKVDDPTAIAEFPEVRQGWVVLERHNRNNVEIVTVLDSLPAEDIRIHYPQLLSVAWGYESLPNGLPTEPEIARGRLLYTALDRILGQDGYYAISRTGNGVRTIHYYVRNFQNHSAALTEYLDSLPPISVKVALNDEPQWNSVSEILSNVGQ